MTRPNGFEIEYVISKNVRYKCSEEATKGSHSNEGILEVGRE
jgi:hypothetical protein